SSDLILGPVAAVCPAEQWRLRDPRSTIWRPHRPGKSTATCQPTGHQIAAKATSPLPATVRTSTSSPTPATSATDQTPPGSSALQTTHPTELLHQSGAPTDPQDPHRYTTAATAAPRRAKSS